MSGYPLASRRLGAIALFIAGIVSMLAFVPTGADADAPSLPDPLDRGQYAVTYVNQAKLGTVPIQEPASSGGAATGVAATTNLNIRGALYYPTDRTEPSPVIVLVHGNHASCDSGSAPNCTVFKRNDQGYAYLGENLATWGYTVFSLDQDQLIYYQDSNKGKGMHQRRRLIQATLDQLTAANAAPLADGANTNIGSTLVGRLDMNRIGLMGHSRGGDGVTSFLDYNRMRPVGTRYPIRGVISLAPVDYERKAPYGTPYLTVVGMCDGDVSNDQGSRFFERSQYIKGDDPFPRIQMIIQGANHNWFNSVWFADGDDATGTDVACGPSTANSIRLSGQAGTGAGQSYVINNNDKGNPAVNTRISGDPARMGDQEKIGLATMAAFFRRYIGGEGAFEPYMTGELSATDANHRQLPQSACPTSTNGTRIACKERLMTSYFAPPDERVDVIRPDTDDPTGTSALGTKIVAQGFADPYANDGVMSPKPAMTASGLDWCNPEPNHFTPSQIGVSGNPTAYRPCPLPAVGALGGQSGTRENSPVNQSYGRQLTIAWNNPMSGPGGKPATIETMIPAADGDLSGLKSLAMGAAVNYFDSRNPARTGNAQWDPAATTQDFEITLTDSKGNSATVDAGDEDYGNALHQSLGSTTARMHIVLNQIRVPLSDFADQGVDLSSVHGLKLSFGGAGMPQSGSIELADIRFQEAVGDPEVLVDSTAPNAGPATGPVATGPDPVAELAETDSSRGNFRLPDTVGVGDSSTAWVVDDDREQCPNAPFTSIQAAIDQAAPWDTIVVCAGTYQESSTPATHASSPAQTGSRNGLTITKSLKIKGAGADRVTIMPSPSLGSSLYGTAAYLRDGGGNVITVERPSLGSTDDNEIFVDISGVTVKSPDAFVESGVSYFNTSGRIANSVVGPFRRVGSAGQLASYPHGWGVIATNSLIGAGAGTVERQVTIADSKVTGYQTGGVLIDGARGTDGNADNTVRQGIREFGYVRDSVIEGESSSVFPQTGIKYASGAKGFVDGSRITGNFYGADQRQSVGLLLTDADTESGSDGMTGISGSVITGNGYGVFNANAANGAIRNGAPVEATGNYWGGSAPVEGPSTGGAEGISGLDSSSAPSVNAAAALAEEPPVPSDYTPAGDAPPSGAIVNPGNGARIPYDANAEPVVFTRDDYGISSVELKVDGETLGVKTKGPYQFDWTPGVTKAGRTVTLEAVITDSAGQTASSATTVRVPSFPPAPAVAVTPASADFGSRAVSGGPTAGKQFVVTNDGNADLVIKRVKRTGTDAASFAVDGTGCAGRTLAPDAQCTIAASFDPTAVGPKGAAIEIETNAVDSPATIGLSGLGTADPLPQIAMTPDSFDFGSKAKGDGATAAQVFTVANTGDADLVIGSVRRAGKNPGRFPFDPSGCAGRTIAPNGTCTIAVAFDPSRTGSVQAKLQVRSNAGLAVSNLTGFGTSDPSPSISPSSTSFDFGIWGVPNGPAPTQVLTLTNNGDARLHIAAVKFGGGKARQFTLDASACLAAAVRPGESCDVELGFDPTSAGAKAAKLRVRSDARRSRVKVDLAGIGE